jgi:hypothetical protein
MVGTVVPPAGMVRAVVVPRILRVVRVPRMSRILGVLRVLVVPRILGTSGLDWFARGSRIVLRRRLGILFGTFAARRIIRAGTVRPRVESTATVTHLRCRLGRPGAGSGTRGGPFVGFAGRPVLRRRSRRRGSSMAAVVVGLRTTVFAALARLGSGKRHRGTSTPHEQPRRNYESCRGDAYSHSHVRTPPTTPEGRPRGTRQSASPILNDSCTIMVNCLLAVGIDALCTGRNRPAAAAALGLATPAQPRSPDHDEMTGRQPDGPVQEA